MADTDICIVGGGVVGLCSAYYLQNSGFRVTVIDRSAMNSGASYVNAGYITPSHIIPLSSPGMPAKGLKYMFDPASPFYLKPRFERSLASWSWKFYRKSTRKHVETCAPVLKMFNEESKALYERLAKEEELDFGYTKSGLLKICRTKEKFLADKISAEFAMSRGLDVRILSQPEVMEINT